MNKNESGPDASPQTVEKDNSLFSVEKHKLYHLFVLRQRS